MEGCGKEKQEEGRVDRMKAKRKKHNVKIRWKESCEKEAAMEEVGGGRTVGWIDGKRRKKRKD